MADIEPGSPNDRPPHNHDPAERQARTEELVLSVVTFAVVLVVVLLIIFFTSRLF